MAPATPIIPIQLLDPSVCPPAGQAIRAVVTLCWPYSSSTRQCALLLADPDFRLRSRKGQVRVRFHGVAAQAIAEAKPGIGDEVELQLGDASWVGSGGDGDVVQTPGKSVGELEYRGGVTLKLGTEGRSMQEITVTAETPNVRTHTQIHAPVADASVQPKSLIGEKFKSSFGTAPEASSTYISPAFIRRTPFGGEDALDLLLGDDAEGDGSPRKRVRVSIGEVRDWRIVSRTPSPVKESLPIEPVSSPLDLDASTNVASISSIDGNLDVSRSGLRQEISSSPTPMPKPIDKDVDANAMLPPTLPRLQVPVVESSPDVQMENGDEPTTPRLQPVSSTKLIAPSPFPTDIAPHRPAPYFREVPDTYAEDDQIIGVDTGNAAESVNDIESQPQTPLEVGSPERNDHTELDHASIHVESLSPDESHVSSPELHSDPHEADDQLYLPSTGHAAHITEDDGARGVHATKTSLEVVDVEVGAEPQPQASPSRSTRQSSLPDEEDVGSREVHQHSEAGTLEPATASAEKLASPVPPSPPLRPQQSSKTRKAPKQSTESSTFFKSGWDAAASSGSALSSGWAVDGSDQLPVSQRYNERPHMSGSDRVLNGTFKSLFGFTGTPSPTKEDPPALGPAQQNEADDEGVGHASDAVAQSIQRQPNARESSPAAIPHFDGPAASKPSILSWRATSPVKALHEPLSPLPDISTGTHANRMHVEKAIAATEDAVQHNEEVDLPVYSGQPPPSTAQSAINVIDLGSSSDAEDSPESPVEMISDHAEQDPRLPSIGGSPTAPQYNGAMESVETFDEVDDVDYSAFINDDDDSDAEVDRSRLASLAVQSIATFGSNAMTPVLPDDVESVASVSKAASVRHSSFEPMIIERSPTPVDEPYTELNLGDEGLGVDHSRLLGSSPAESSGDDAPIATAESSFQQISSTPPAPSQRSPAPKMQDIEMLDLSQPYVNEYAPPFNSQLQFLSQQSRYSNRVAVEDSIDSPQTTLIDETSSRPGTGSSMAQFHAQLDEQQRHFEEQPVGREQQQIPTQKPRPQQRSAVVKSVSASPGLPDITVVDGSSGSPAASLIDDAQFPSSQADAHVNESNVVDSARSSKPEIHHVTSKPDSQPPNDVLQRLFGISKSTEAASPAPETQDLPHANGTSLEVSYPRLPFTPSFSQSQSFGFETQLRPPQVLNDGELQNADELPPTPQLTQQLSEVSQAITSQNEQHSEKDSQPVEQNTDVEVAAPHQELVVAADEVLHDHKPSPEPAIAPAEVLQDPKVVAEQVTAPPKTPHRKSVTARLSHVPEVISAWFSPKSKPSSTVRAATNGHTLPVTTLLSPAPQLPQPTGLRTPHAYFHPLSSLTTHINPTSQTPPATIDVLAIITSPPTPPQRAKLGPKDYHTTLRISDPSLPPPSKSLRVDISRHWKAVLPTGKAGDVVLLRGFVVKALKGAPGFGLRARGESAWCVWRFGEVGRLEGEGLDENNDSGRLSVREEVKGPPVEFGEPERARVRELRGWWGGVVREGRGVVEEEEGNV